MAQATCPLRESILQGGQNHGGEGRHSGELVRPIHEIARPAVAASTAKTELEAYKLSLRRYHPVDKGLPWACQSHCTKCDSVVPGRFVYDERGDQVFLEFACPRCGTYRERHEDVLFVKDLSGHRARAGEHQPTETFTGARIRPVLKGLPRTVETLCPDCSCIILGRYYEKDNIVYIEKTCPEHGYFRDRISSDARMYLRATRGIFEDERGVHAPQVKGGRHCPTDCGLCSQHLSTSVLAQIDMSNRCNLTCPICFANANVAGYVSEPTYDMVVEMLQTLRDQHPHPGTSVQFTGGEPTLHPDFCRLVAKAREMGFSHVQVATNGITFAEEDFARRASEAGLHTLYLQFDGVGEHFYRITRGEDGLFAKKLACIENCRKYRLKVCLVPTIIKGLNDDQVGEILRFACENIDTVSGISYQPVTFAGRISHKELESKRYTLADLAHDLSNASGADLVRDFLPLGSVAPLSRIMECLDGKPKITASCHSDCAFGSYMFVTPDHKPIPIPSVFDFYGLMKDFNRYAKKIKTRHPKANGWERLHIAWFFFKRYRWSRFLTTDIRPWTFIKALGGMTNKDKGRGKNDGKTYKTLLTAGMHFMDRYNFDCERVKRCVILYSTVDGVYPFCTINGGPTFRPYIERMYAESKEEWQARNPGQPLRPSIRNGGSGEEPRGGCGGCAAS